MPMLRPMVAVALLAFLPLTLLAAEPAVELGRDQAAFDAAFPNAKRLDFEHGALGNKDVVVRGALDHGGEGPQLLTTLVGLPHLTFFGSSGSAPSFVLSNLVAQINFREDTVAAGFDLACFACDTPESPFPFTIVLLDDRGRMIYYNDYDAQLLPPIDGAPASFLSFTSTIPFRTIVITRHGNWMLDDLRYLSAHDLVHGGHSQ